MNSKFNTFSGVTAAGWKTSLDFEAS
ncbi:Protein of unknown function [Bacillus cereus]|nr:Protein of unknown function [Bacillus cereus]